MQHVYLCILFVLRTQFKFEYIYVVDTEICDWKGAGYIDNQLASTIHVDRMYAIFTTLLS